MNNERIERLFCMKNPKAFVGTVIKRKVSISTFKLTLLLYALKVVLITNTFFDFI